MHIRTALCYLPLALLLACGQAPEQQATPPASAPAPASQPVAAPATPAVPVLATRPLAADWYAPFAASADTVLRGPGRYALYWQVRLDTLERLFHHTAPDPARHFPGDTSVGYQGYYTFVVRDSLGRVVGKHTFRKQDFYPAVGPELAIGSGAYLPKLLGYSAALGGLVATVPFNASGTDWYGEAVLVLAPTGQLRYLASGGSDGGPAVETTLSRDGRTLLSADYLWHAGQPHRPLARAGAELRGAMLLNDTLALTLYEPGQPHRAANGFPYLTSTPAQRRQPNAFVRDVRNHHLISSFRYDGFYAELGYIVPWQYVPQTHTAYLLDADRGLYQLPLRQPAAGRLLPFAALPHASGPPRAGEVAFQLSGPAATYRILADTANAASVRYQLVQQ